MCVNDSLFGFVTYVWLKIENLSRIIREMEVPYGGRPPGSKGALHRKVSSNKTMGPVRLYAHYL